MGKVLNIIEFLEKQDLLKDKDQFWWPAYGTFEVVIGAILTQNTTWINVEKSLKNLQYYLTLESFITLNLEDLKHYIIPSGFYNQKSQRLLELAYNIKNQFNSFENFQKNATRIWLLEQKGIGDETADSILCYCCKKDELTIDTYTKRLLKLFDIEFKTYIQYKIYLEDGIENNWQILSKRYKNNKNLCYAQLHGMIVEYNKKERLKNV